jgi:hypothetical protein
MPAKQGKYSALRGKDQEEVGTSALRRCADFSERQVEERRMRLELALELGCQGLLLLTGIIETPGILLGLSGKGPDRTRSVESEAASVLRTTYSPIFSSLSTFAHIPEPDMG